MRLIQKNNDLPLVWGHLIVCKERNDNGELVAKVDNQGDYFNEDAVVEAAREFMKSDNRWVLDSHSGLPIGKVIFAWPDVEDILKAEGTDMDSINKTGLKVAVEVLPEYVDLFKDGTYNSFSVGGILNESVQFEVNQ